MKRTFTKTRHRAARDRKNPIKPIEQEIRYGVWLWKSAWAIWGIKGFHRYELFSAIACMLAKMPVHDDFPPRYSL